MILKTSYKKVVLVTVIQFVFVMLFAQPGVPFTKWTNDGNAYYQVEKGEIMKIELPSQNKTPFIKKQPIIATGRVAPYFFCIGIDQRFASIG